jgi:hypothetical protein
MGAEGHRFLPEKEEMNASEVNNIIRENKARRKALFAPYDPVTGVGSPIERERIEFSVGGNELVWGIPVTMYNENAALFDAITREHKLESVLQSHGIPADNTGIELFLRDLINQRFRYDFEFWAVTAARIQDKRTKQIVPFSLNQPQRKVLAVLERMRVAGVPIRIIIDKARQWGGSTLIQIYMAWIQLIHKSRWHSCIVTDVEEQARNIRAMYSRLITNYPKDLGGFELSPLEGSNKNRRIDERDCSIIIGSSQKPDSLRTFDLAMSHLSEVSFWRTTELRSAEDLAQSVRAGVAQVPFSLIALESTAKGVGNFFHREWLSAMDGKSAYAPVFVAWFEIEMYQKDIKEADLPAFVKRMDADPYASYLWSLGATLEGIKWYFDFKAGENYDEWRMKSEFPSTWEESFQATGARVFSPAYVNQARKHKMDPEFVGDIRGKTIRDKTALEDIELIQADRGSLLIWMFPDKEENVSNRYVVSMDIGGRSPGADYTVMRVFDRYAIMDGGVPEAVATWKGHCDQDLGAWKGVQLARMYNNALFIPESNSYDKTSLEAEGDHFLTILDEIVKYYPNIFARTDPEKIRQGAPLKYGFHTNPVSKPMIIDFMNAALRDELYYERDDRVFSELDTYEIKPNGRYGAVDGCHDDMVMATAIGLWACLKHLPPPKIIKPTAKRRPGRITEATI